MTRAPAMPFSASFCRLDDFQIATEAQDELLGFVFDIKSHLDADAVRLGRLVPRGASPRYRAQRITEGCARKVA
jgi:hypothetical protein